MSKGTVKINCQFIESVKGKEASQLLLAVLTTKTKEKCIKNYISDTTCLVQRNGQAPFSLLQVL